MNTLKAPSLQSLLESDRGSNDSLLAESLQLDIEEVKSKQKQIFLSYLNCYYLDILCSWMILNIPYQR